MSPSVFRLSDDIVNNAEIRYLKLTAYFFSWMLLILFYNRKKNFFQLGKKLYITIAITDKMEIIMSSFTTKQTPFYYYALLR